RALAIRIHETNLTRRWTGADECHRSTCREWLFRKCKLLNRGGSLPPKIFSPSWLTELFLSSGATRIRTKRPARSCAILLPSLKITYFCFSTARVRNLTRLVQTSL